MTQSENSEIVIAIRFGGEVRELIGIKTTPKGDTYVFPPYARAREAYAHLLRERHGYKRAPFPPVDVHMSKHHSGARHLRVRLGRKDHPTPESEVKLQPTSNFLGVELISHNPLFKGQLADLPPLGTNNGKI